MLASRLCAMRRPTVSSKVCQLPWLPSASSVSGWQAWQVCIRLQCPAYNMCCRRLLQVTSALYVRHAASNGTRPRSTLCTSTWHIATRPRSTPCWPRCWMRVAASACGPNSMSHLTLFSRATLPRRADLRLWVYEILQLNDSLYSRTRTQIYYLAASCFTK